MCGTRLAANTGRKKSSFWHHRTTLSGYIFATKACIHNRKKNLLSSNTSSTCPHNMANFGLLTAEICWRVWGTPADFNGLCVLAALLHGTLIATHHSKCSKGSPLMSPHASRWSLHWSLAGRHTTCWILLLLHTQSLSHWSVVGYPRAVAHHSTNRARCRTTLLMCLMPLPLCQTAINLRHSGFSSWNMQ